MSIWRTIICDECKGDLFDVADNGMDSDIRLVCEKCERVIMISIIDRQKNKFNIKKIK